MNRIVLLSWSLPHSPCSVRSEHSSPIDDRLTSSSRNVGRSATGTVLCIDASSRVIRACLLCLLGVVCSTALHIAISLGNMHAVRALVRNGANINTPYLPNNLNYRAVSGA